MPAQGIRRRQSGPGLLNTSERLQLQLQADAAGDRKTARAQSGRAKSRGAPELTLGGALCLVVQGLDALFDELVASLAQLEDVGALGRLCDELLDDAVNDAGGRLVLVKGGGGDCVARRVDASPRSKEEAEAGRGDEAQGGQGGRGKGVTRGEPVSSGGSRAAWEGRKVVGNEIGGYGRSSKGSREGEMGVEGGEQGRSAGSDPRGARARVGVWGKEAHG